MPAQQKSPTAQRSGRSTPVRGTLKDDVPLDEEEEKRRAEEEEKERLQKEAKAKLEEERMAALNLIRDQQLGETQVEIESIQKHLEKLRNDKLANAEWERYVRCDGRPDPTKLKDINTYISLLRENGSPDVNVVLEDATLILSLLSELDGLIKEAPSTCDDVTVDDYVQTALNLQELLISRYNEATLKILKEASFEADSETGNLQKVIRGEHETIMLWGNLNKNPRFKQFEFDREKFTFELPKVLAMADVAVRVLKTQFDHYSHQCTTFKQKPKKKSVDAAAEVVESAAPVEGELVEEDGEEKEAGEENPATDDASDAKSVTSERRKSGGPTSDDPVETASQPPASQAGDAQGADSIADDVALPPVPGDEEDEDDILDPDVVDLRQFSPLGDVFHVDLVRLPPQPTVVRGWTLTQILDEPLTPVRYPVEQSRAASAVEGEGKTPEAQPGIGITISLPADVMFFEEPQVAIWDEKAKHWKTSGITDINYDEEKLMLSYKTAVFGTFCLLQDAHLCMPFQSWELRPGGPDQARFTVTSACTETEIDIEKGRCKLKKPEEGASNELNSLYEVWMSAPDLISRMRKAGVNIFPEPDSNKYVNIQDKTMDVELVYDQMSLLACSFTFAWSKWSSDATEDQLIFQMAPLLVEAGAKAVFVKEEDWGTYMLKHDRCYKLQASEFDDEMSDELADDCQYQSDLLHCARNTPLRNDPDHAVRDQLVRRSHQVDQFFANTVQTLLRATKVLTYS